MKNLITMGNRKSVKLSKVKRLNIRRAPVYIRLKSNVL